MLLKSWRPLTLLTVDYKILAKALAEHIKTVLPEIISEHQTTFIEKRQISTTIRKTIDIINFTKNKKIKGFLLSIDFEKCFDRIEYDAMLGVLKYFDFGDNYLEWIRLLLTDFYSCTTSNGYQSDWIHVTRSCHQGDPLAPYLFLVCGEVMSQIITQNSDVEGITIYGLKEIMSQFADDTQIFIRNTIRSLTAIVNSLTLLEANTGLIVNYKKSSIHTLGGAERIECEKPFVWDPGSLEVLGINPLINDDSMYEKQLQKMSVTITQWANRSLPLIGKIVLINSLMGSLFVYKFQVLEDPSNNTIRLFNQLIHKFLWGDKKAKISTKILQAHKQNGGLALIDLKAKAAAQKIAWIFREDEFTMNLLKFVIPNDMGKLFWECTLHPRHVNKVVNKQTPEFWKQMITHWFELTWKDELTEKEEIENQIIWYNSFICTGGMPHSKPPTSSVNDITYVKDIINESGEFKNFEEIQTENSTITWLKYRAICTAIPRDWIKKVKTTKNNDKKFTTMYKRLSISRKPVKMVYGLLTQKNNPIHELYRKISKYVNISLECYEQSFNWLYFNDQHS